MAIVTVTQALKKLYKSIVGEDTTKNNPTKIISELADNWPGGGGGGESWTTLTEESVTLSGSSPDYASAGLEYSQIINADSIRVTLNGTAYVCQRSVDEIEGNVYGASFDESTETYDWSEFPFQIWSGDDDGISTVFTVPTAGTYTVKIEAPQSGGDPSPTPTI